MIPKDFDYYRPDTLKEAVATYQQAANAGLKPYYYGGGTEIITMARVSDLSPDAVIDVKNIPECTEHGLNNGKFVFGAGVTLSAIAETDLFPLLSLACTRIADHTVQDKITLGGNICGSIIYRESMLPLLLADAEITTVRADGFHKGSVVDVMNSGRRLQDGELLVKVSVAKEWAKEKYWHIKKVKTEKIGYPVASVSALSAEGTTRIAFSGICAFPVRITEMENAYPPEKKDEIAEGYIRHLPASILQDLEGSAAYREFVLINTLLSILNS